MSGGGNLGRKTKEGKRQLSLSPLLLPVWQSGCFCFLPQLPLFSTPSMTLPCTICFLLLLSHLFVSFQTLCPPSLSFSGHIPLCRGHTSECHGWHSPKYLRSLSVCFRISPYYPTSLTRLSRFPWSQNDPCTHPCPSPNQVGSLQIRDKCCRLAVRKCRHFS